MRNNLDTDWSDGHSVEIPRAEQVLPPRLARAAATEKVESFFNLRNEISPQVLGGSRVHSRIDRNEMIFKAADSTLRFVPAML